MGTPKKKKICPSLYTPTSELMFLVRRIELTALESCPIFLPEQVVFITAFRCVTPLQIGNDKLGPLHQMFLCFKKPSSKSRDVSCVLSERSFIIKK